MEKINATARQFASAHQTAPKSKAVQKSPELKAQKTAEPKLKALNKAPKPKTEQKEKAKKKNTCLSIDVDTIDLAQYKLAIPEVNTASNTNWGNKTLLRFLEVNKSDPVPEPENVFRLPLGSL